MFKDKLVFVIATWAIVCLAYLIMAGTMEVNIALNGEAISGINASIAGTDYTPIGVVDWLGAWPLIMWFIPGLVGTVATVIRLRLP